MLKCDHTLGQRCSPVNLMHIFRKPFPKNTSGGLLLSLTSVKRVGVSFSTLFKTVFNHNSASAPLIYF